MTLREIFEAEKVDLDKLLDADVGGPVMVVGKPTVAEVNYSDGAVNIRITIP